MFTFFANVELSHGYWQLALDRVSHDCQSILTPEGMYAPARVLHGTTYAVAHLQCSLLAVVPSVLRPAVASVTGEHPSPRRDYSCPPLGKGMHPQIMQGTQPPSPSLYVYLSLTHYTSVRSHPVKGRCSIRPMLYRYTDQHVPTIYWRSSSAVPVCTPVHQNGYP